MSSTQPTDAPASTEIPRPTRLLVALPALDEAATISRVVAAVPQEIPGIHEISILVVDDGSTDDTGSIARDAGAHVIRHVRSTGVGAAFRTALNHALEMDVDFLVTIDADGQFDPRDIWLLSQPVISGEYDFASASRFKDPTLTPRMPWIKRWGNRQMSRLISRLTQHQFFDVSCGMRCYNRRAMLNLNLMGAYTYTQEVFLNLAFKRLRIIEVPIAVRGVREHGKSRVVDSLWGYGFRALRIILAAYRDYNPMRFFGGLAIAIFVPAVFLALFLGFHYLRSGFFSPHKWAGFMSAALILLSILLTHIGLIGDMLNRHRVYLEELLFYSRLSGAAKDAVDRQRTELVSSDRADLRLHPGQSHGQPTVDATEESRQQPKTPARTK